MPTIYLLGLGWANGWVLFESAHHLPAGYEPGKLFQNPQLTHNVSTGYIALRPQCHQGAIHLVDVRFYFRATVAGVQESLSLGSMYSLVDDAIKEHSHGALNVHKHEGEDSLVVIRADSILSAVAMVPFKQEDAGQRFALVEHPALDIINPDNALDVE